jgi:hypothetical protein
MRCRTIWTNQLRTPTWQPMPNGRSASRRRGWPTSLIGVRPKSGATGPMRRGELWRAGTPGATGRCCFSPWIRWLTGLGLSWWRI